MNKTLLVFLCLFIAFSGYSQNRNSKSRSVKTPPKKATVVDTTKAKPLPANQPKLVTKSKNTTGFTFEVEKADAFYLIPSERNGFVILYSNEEKKSGMITWNVALYDTNLTKTWETSIQTKKKSKMVDYKRNGSSIYVLYGVTSLSDGGLAKDLCSLVKLDLNAHQAKMIDAVAPTDFTYSGMDVSGDEVTINGLNNLQTSIAMSCKLYCNFLLCCIPTLTGWLYLKDQPFAYTVNTGNGNKTIYPMSVKGNNYVSNVWNASDNSSYFICTNKQDPKTTNVWLYNLKGGSVKSSQKLDLTNGTVLKDVSGYDLDGNRTILLGIYGDEMNYAGKKWPRKIFNVINSDATDGICVNELDGGKLIKTSKFDFSKVKNLLSDVTITKGKKIELKKGICASDVCTDYSLRINKVINNGADGFIVMAESYILDYEVHYRYVYDSHGGHVESYLVFAGYEFLEGIVMKLDESGRFTWGQAFPIGETLTPNIRNKMSIKKVADDEYTLIYPLKDGIYSRTYTGNSISEESKLDEIKKHITMDNEKLKSYSMVCEPWFSNNELIYGMEKVKKKGEGTHYKIYVNQFSYDY